ncbi:chemotaxis response regulator protein-glutamate methylesterase [Alteromonas sp. McT4-15]|jgi:two-component system chemotaxis response regulator CheB|uniref:protein-glutamate methylesterase/protein-glutamine glutaminase n=1 Tax=unclassified Alteromonas TaxID=2614992 RepID=UPI0012E598FF|nr:MULTISPECIES: chemotaxis response regulator protein-glutamate methylesterase [unclassified Alteromonas]MCB4435303.1 chemotaxis response regulator protein-glutamate methylesterase [Alteromonas sp. McT4-15]BCO18184.1 chemotaxis response regulator protein-glutamate methylesterase [Alteromonas sp. KC3]BCO22145.1 chemotaxis response regulator protein-glutamate methylesterase [Alteromonas sp. KC14]GFD88062.1 chemotaxis response regulator protein-glutamate methylesterase [Tenacibaculum sp. KUL152]
MVFKVLVVDDSTFYRRRVKEILDADRELEVVGEARNGRDALEKLETLTPDVITMDVEMPIMDGISAVKAIMEKRPTPILMFSSLTHHGAQATLDALEAGALDFLPKKFEDIAQDRKDATRLLCTKVRLIARRGVGLKRPVMRSVETRRLPENAPKPAFFRSSGLLSGRKDAAKQPTVSSVRPSGKHYKCLAIGASTGGPVALQKVLSPLPADFPYPIVLVQHMPGTFTSAFAQRLDSNCKISVKEAETGDVLKPGHAYLAPGGKQMIIESAGVNKTITIVEASAADKVSYKPSVDLTFSSIARAYGGDVLGVILTGMGADGREGCRTLKGLGATIWAQDQDSCVVYGMPQAVAVENISSKSINIDDISSCIQSEMR